MYKGFVSSATTSHKGAVWLESVNGKYGIPFTIALGKVLFSTQKYLYFSYFLVKTYVVGTR